MLLLTKLIYTNMVTVKTQTSGVSKTVVISYLKIHVSLAQL
jgi:hypothetical protein